MASESMTKSEDDDWEFVVIEEEDATKVVDEVGVVDASRMKSTGKDGLSSNYKTFGAVGKGERILHSGTEAVLLDHNGDAPGCITHFWFGGNFDNFEETRIRYYVDGDDSPSIDMALYLGHGIGFHDNQNTPWVTKYVGKVGRKNGIHNNYRIPFTSTIRVTAERLLSPNNNNTLLDNNEDDATPQSWWILRGITHVKISLGGMELPSPARLHLVKLENYAAQPLEEFDLCNIPGGPGALFLVVIQAQSKSLAYLEACMRAYMGPPNKQAHNNNQDTDEPLRLSSGLEDYFLGTYYFDTGLYHADISGLTSFDKQNGSFSAYRFHDRDPVFFENGLRLTCRCGETEHGSSSGKPYLHPQVTTYTTYTWYYQW